MGSSYEPSNLIDDTIDLHNEIKIKAESEQNIQQLTSTNTTINNPRNGRQLPELAKSYIMYFPKSININKSKYSSKYRKTSSCNFEGSNHSSDTTTQNSRNISVIIENKRKLRMNGYRKKYKEYISKKESLDCSAHNKGFVKSLHAVEILLDENQDKDEESMNWETVNETDISSDSASSTNELSDNQEENSSLGIHSHSNNQHEDDAYADSNSKYEHNDISNINAKTMELRTKISTPIENEATIPEPSFTFEQKFKRLRKNLFPNILDTRVPDTEGADVFPLDSSLNHSDEVLNSCLPKFNKQSFILDVNNDDGIACQLQSENDNHTKIIQHESISEIVNTSNTDGVDIEREVTHRDIGVMVNMSLESHYDDNKVLTNEANAIADVPIAVRDFVRGKLDKVDIENIEYKTIIESILSDFLEKRLEEQKNFFEDTLDYIIDRVINRYLEKCKESEVDNIEGVEVNRKIMRKPVKKSKVYKIVRKRFCPKNVPAKKTLLVKRLKKRNYPMKLYKDKIINLVTDTTAETSTKNANNQIYESVEQLTTKATFEESGKCKKGDHISSRCNNLYNNNIPDVFSNTNLSNISNNFSAISTSFKSNHTTCVENNNCRIAAIIAPQVLQENISTIQTSLTKTHNTQHTQANNGVTTCPINTVMGKEYEKMVGSESMDDLYITMDFTQCLTDDMGNNIVHLEKDGKLLNPNLPIGLEPSQVSAIQLSCKEALKKND